MNDLKFQGEIVKISDIQEGVSQKGTNWKKLGFIVKTSGEYPSEVYFTVFGEEKVDNFMKYNKVGQMVEVSFNINCREYNERYYTDLNAWKVFTLKDEVNQTDDVIVDEDYHTVNGEVEEDLPF
tara:strand:+ start:2290 stop:2661 length:372 start_codon:yes stop_codon:yes gene_type:complete